MKLITRDTDYAVRAMICIASSPSGSSSVKELSEELDIPVPFLRKILQVLSRKGILRSGRGRGGGFKMGAEAGKITILDIIEALQGEFFLSEHVFKGRKCPLIKVCGLKKKLDELEELVARELKGITVKDLLKKR